jgi:glucosamine-phosphate N-acetyltransferase
MNHVETTLFSNSLISPKVQASLPKGYVLRPLQSGDYERGFLNVLKVLTEVGDHTKAQWLGNEVFWLVYFQGSLDA